MELKLAMHADAVVVVVRISVHVNFNLVISPRELPDSVHRSAPRI